eukprot:TRINITY_DN5832_c0_g2_i1.p2 TRINITY_DN5832_c0_g2~~TRINITY_DN5832_c0_g2_i1.p2  ORF type:complete len:112 (-),score=35.20 TRINITY_DN5832_c0_g2_i1:636-971(-)
MVMLIGNKSDDVDNRVVEIDEIMDYVKEKNLDYMETSAKEDSNVNEAFEHVLNELYHMYKQDDDVIKNNKEEEITPIKSRKVDLSEYYKDDSDSGNAKISNIDKKPGCCGS